jgi:ubiquinone/menaquinone biosynthesis C-methylase UbiE
MKKKQNDSSWEGVSSWYNDIVGSKGHYYHEHVIFPKLLPLLKLQNNGKESLLDLACGQGVLSRRLPKEIPYTGVDASTSLISLAKKMDKNPKHIFCVADLAKPLALTQKEYTHATILLALQNIADPLQVIKNGSEHLCRGGRFYIVINHPCFRIPRQTSWQVDEERKIQYRRVDRYMSPLSIPIQAHPSQGVRSKETLSFHRSLSTYTAYLKEAGLLIEMIDEWCSDKTSSGSKAKMENRAREEIPLFLAIVAKKV